LDSSNGIHNFTILVPRHHEDLLSAFVAAAVSRYRPLGSFARTPPHAFDDPFGVTSDQDASQMKILSANEDRVIVEETQGNCAPDVLTAPVFGPTTIT
jgi:hypothetical protein